MIRRHLARLLIRLAGWIAQPAPTPTAPTPRLRAIYATKLRTALAMAREVIR